MSLPIRGKLPTNAIGEQQLVVSRTDEEGRVSSIALPILKTGGFSAWWRGDAVGLKVREWDEKKGREVTKKVYIPTEGIKTLFGSDCKISHGIGRQLASMLYSFAERPLIWVSLEKMMSLLVPEQSARKDDPTIRLRLQTPLDILKKDLLILGFKIPRSWKSYDMAVITSETEFVRSIWIDLVLENFARSNQILPQKSSTSNKGTLDPRRCALLNMFKDLCDQVQTEIDNNPPIRQTSSKREKKRFLENHIFNVCQKKFPEPDLNTKSEKENHKFEPSCHSD